MSVKVFLGDFLHTPVRGTVELLDDRLVEVDSSGRIAHIVGPGGPGRVEREREAQASGQLTRAGERDVFLPGLVDLHIHAPQWPQLGRALHLPLEQWLWQYTFPLEARCADTAYAASMYDELVAALLREGTTTAVYFGSVHLEATQALAQACVTHGQRALVGKVVMDERSQCPDDYRDESTSAALAQTAALADAVAAMPGNASGRVEAAVTPRFIPSCTDQALHALGGLARDRGLPVQTHCAESDWESAFVRERTGRSDAHALDTFGLLTRRTVLAHGNFLDDADLARLGARGAGVAHCPLSNAYFADSVLPLRSVLDAGVHAGLGTDISGGPSASLFDNVREAITSSRILEHGADPALPALRRGRPGARIDFREALWLATAGGAQVLDLPVGRFAVGCAFDALLLDSAGARRQDRGDADDVAQRLVYRAGASSIRGVWTDGEARVS